MQVLQSRTDLSANFVEQSLEGFLESRYVRRNATAHTRNHHGANPMSTRRVWPPTRVLHNFDIQDRSV
jgi:hypothetical protein